MLINNELSDGSKKSSGGLGRLVALDVARGLAVLGMYVQHFALNDKNAAIVSGNTTLLFVLCGGISYSLMAQRMRDKGIEKTAFRSRMLARAVFIDLIGYAIIMLNIPFGVILPAYSALFILALPLVNRLTRVLITTAIGLILLGPPVMVLGGSLFSEASLLYDIAGGPMSALALSSVFVAGMAIGRLDLTNTRTALSLAGSGTIMLIISIMLSKFVLPDLSQSFEKWLISVLGISSVELDSYAIWPHNVESPMWHSLLWTSPHSASTFQTLMGLGAAFLALGLVCFISKRFSKLLIPFALVGRMALTMYALQFVVVWVILLTGGNYSLGEIPFGDILIVIIALVVGWLLSCLPKGPLEASMRRFESFFTLCNQTEICINDHMKEKM
ncbi:DUF418 domain-containing protein [Viridibacillus arvi]|uniref:DUF418 domain-containing protein n=1 Tax=Viridibacillus arvi TaxID=263475 RepID=UPI003D2E5451